MPLLHKVTIALFTVFAVVWSYLAFYPDSVLSARGLSPDAKAFVSESLKDFCGGLYTDGVCPATDITGKQKWIATTNLGRSDIPAQQADAVLAAQGWQKVAAENERFVMFCKQGYSARYERKAGNVGILAFAGGSHYCEKLASKNQH
jgi:hypothetical protein